MDRLALHVQASQREGSNASFPIGLAPRPQNQAQTGLSENLLQGLVAKHLYDGGVMSLAQLSARIALAGPILEDILHFMRRQTLVEIRGPNGEASGLRYALTDRGRAFALEELAKGGYIGPAPVPIEQYAKVVQAQSVYRHRVTQAQMRRAFAGVTLRESLLDQLGPALHSGRAIFIYGPAGTGKTYIGRRLAWLLGGDVLVPHAIAIGESIIQVFDPLIHKPVSSADTGASLMLTQGHDPRFVLCQRPAVMTGGELTLDMLEVNYEPATRQHQAPLQLKANNGLYMIDDLGRQRAGTAELFNRWIVPMEMRQDYLSLVSGKRFPVPFDVILIFSTNLDPTDLADDAFLRRLGRKIQFGYLRPNEYTAIWRQVCEERGIPFDPELLVYALDELHGKRDVPLLPCHPRDILGLALDEANYLDGQGKITTEMLERAWQNYFVGPASYARPGESD